MDRGRHRRSDGKREGGRAAAARNNPTNKVRQQYCAVSCEHVIHLAVSPPLIRITELRQQRHPLTFCSARPSSYPKLEVVLFLVELSYALCLPPPNNYISPPGQCCRCYSHTPERSLSGCYSWACAGCSIKILRRKCSTQPDGVCCCPCGAEPPQEARSRFCVASVVPNLTVCAVAPVMRKCVWVAVAKG